jgi:hypothetical protein
MKKLYMGLLLLSFILATYNCNRSTANPKMDETLIEMSEQLNEMEEEIIREGKSFDGAIDSFEMEEGTEEKLIYEDYSDLK